MSKRSWAIAVIVVAQSMLLMGMIAKKQYTLSMGTPILLKTQPVDPRSLFRGDYVRIRYDIDQLDRKLPGVKAGFQKGDTIYVVLVKDERYWRAVSAHPNKLKLPQGQIAIRGEVRNAQSYRSDIWVSYGINTYFVPEGEGRKLERPQEGDVVDIEVAIDENGDAAIRALLLNGKRVFAETLF